MRRAFSLMETILAAAILSLVFMVLFNLYPSSMVAARRAEHRLNATTLAESIIEAKRALPLTTLTALINPADVTGVPDDADMHAPYRFSWSTEPPPAAGDDGVQVVARFRVRRVHTMDVKQLVCLQVSVRWCEKAKDRDPDELTPAFANRDPPHYQEIVQELWYGDIQH